jgi:outer membrane biosynthesis protein TonB
MPSSDAPDNSNEPSQPATTPPEAGRPVAVEEPGQTESPAALRSRWVDYDTHELLQMITDLEDERRWARLREGIWIAILIHIVLISSLTWIPKYVLNAPRVIDPFDAIKQRKDLAYLDVPPDALRKLQPKMETKPVPEKPAVIDKKTIEDIKRDTPPAPKPAPEPAAQAPVQTPPPPPQQNQQSQFEAPRPAAVPARPNFAMGSQNPGDQLRDAMKGASRNPGMGSAGGNMGGGGLARHPGAGSGGIEVLSDTQGVDFSGWLQRWHRETERTWDPLIPDEVNPPILKSGMVAIRFKVGPNGRLLDGSLVLEGRSGDTALDRAAWGALTGSNYPPLPRDFHGPYLELRAYFLYNMQQR